MSRVLTLIATTLIVAAIWIVVLPSAAVPQPLAFNHTRHMGLGCVVCHSGVESSARATVPAASVCLKCHATAPAPATEAMWAALGHGAPLPWARVTRLPEHVFFSHRRHVVLARLESVSCHGNIASRARPPARNPVRLTMNDCLSCHRREGATEDCATCHR